LATTPLLLDVSEVFYSIQGESSYAGYPCLFIRLAGCNLRCRYCDSRYAYLEKGRRHTVDALLDMTAAHPAALVEITGGEPLLQKNVYPLMERLTAAGRTVLLETNGSMSLAEVPAPVIKIMDIKCPGSGMHDRMDFNNLHYLSRRKRLKDEIKFVISSRQDYDWAVRILKKYALHRKAAVLFSPVTADMEPATLAELILADELPVRLQIQIHTIIWPGLQRGK